MSAHLPETMTVTIRVADRGDGGIEVTSGDVDGLYLGGRDRERIWSVVETAVERLLTVNHGLHVLSVEGPMTAPRPGDVPMQVLHLTVYLAAA